MPWFFFGIADTLPFVPARNILAADRYLYLPIIGLVVLAAAVADAVFRRAGDRVRSPSLPRCIVDDDLRVALPVPGDRVARGGHLYNGG